MNAALAPGVLSVEMKRRLVGIALAILVTLAAAAPGYAASGHGGGRGFSGGHHGHHGPHPNFHHFHPRGHGRVIVGLVPFLAFPYWWDYPAFAYLPPVIQAEPPVYIQQQPTAQPYWFYCPSARAYYPNVSICPEPWVRVPATPR